MREYTETKRPMLYEITTDGIMVFSEKRHGNSDINEAKRWIAAKYKYPIRRIKTATNDRKLYEFMKEVFRHPLTKPLRWYQIKTMTVREFHPVRSKGITVEDYIKKYVLPNVNKTEIENLNKYGETIYSY